jgi:septum formation protein
MNYILASGSPRRKELLLQMGLSSFAIVPSHGEERITKERPAEIVEELSLQKCMDIAHQTIRRQERFKQANADIYQNADGYLILGADTIVADGDTILTKPQDEHHAFAMLQQLRGHSHSVYTGVTLAHIENAELIRQLTFHEETKVCMRDYSDDEIRAYIATGEPMDKAGSYGIQGRGALLVEGIQGDYNNVVGLPITRLYVHLQENHWL